MEYPDLIRLYFERATALQWYWTIYVVVLGGLLAFSSLRQRRAFFTALLVSVLYICFAYKNLGAIEDVVAQRNVVLSNIQDWDKITKSAPLGNFPFKQSIEPTLVASDPASVRNFHILCDVLTVLTLWAMELRRGYFKRAEMIPPITA